MFVNAAPNVFRSVAGLYGYPGLSVYCATKQALEGFSQVLIFKALEESSLNFHPTQQELGQDYVWAHAGFQGRNHGPVC
jgi:hypothetical protein